MPSPDQTHTFSRRQLVTLCGACAGAGALGGYAYGGNLMQEDCDPSPLAASPTEWALPEYDVANTRSVPPESAPSTGLSERWRISYEQPDQPLMINGSVLIAQLPHSRGVVTSYDLYTGEKQWWKAVSGFSSPLTAGGNSLFLGQNRDGDTTVSKSLSTADGSEQWTSDVSSSHITLAPESGHLIFRDAPNVFALNAHTGEQCWQRSFDESQYFRSCVIYDDGIFVLNAGTEGKLIAFDVETGESLWEANISEYFHPNEEDLNDAIRGRLVAGDDRIFLHTFGGLLIGVDAESGETDWVTPENHPEILTSGNRSYAPPDLQPIAYSDDVLLVIRSEATERSDSLRAVDSTTGNGLWVYELDEEDRYDDLSIRSAAIAGERVFLPIMDELHILDFADGVPLDTHSVGGYAHSIALADGVCLVATAKGIIALEAG